MRYRNVYEHSRSMGNTDSTSLTHALRSLTHHHHCVAHKYSQCRVCLCVFFVYVRACVCPLLAATPHRHSTHFHMVIVRKRITIRMVRPIESPPRMDGRRRRRRCCCVDMVHVTKVLLLFMRALRRVHVLGEYARTKHGAHGQQPR